MVALVTPCSPSTTRRLLERFAFQDSTPALIRRELSHLTSRELDVLRLLARGLSNAEIAEQLTFSEATVKAHVARLLAKLQIRDRGTWLYRQDQTRDLISQLRDRPATGRRATRAPTRSASGSTPPGPKSPACGPRTAPAATSSPATSASSEHSTQKRARRIAMPPVANPTLPAGELLELLRWLNPAASPRIAMGARTPGTAWR